MVLAGRGCIGFNCKEVCGKPLGGGRGWPNMLFGRGCSEFAVSLQACPNVLLGRVGLHFKQGSSRLLRFPH